MISKKTKTYKIHEEREFSQARRLSPKPYSCCFAVQFGVVQMYTFKCRYELVLLFIVASVNHKILQLKFMTPKGCKVDSAVNVNTVGITNCIDMHIIQLEIYV